MISTDTDSVPIISASLIYKSQLPILSFVSQKHCDNCRGLVVVHFLEVVYIDNEYHMIVTDNQTNSIKCMVISQSYFCHCGPLAGGVCKTWTLDWTGLDQTRINYNIRHLINYAWQVWQVAHRIRASNFSIVLMGTLFPGFYVKRVSTNTRSSSLDIIIISSSTIVVQPIHVVLVN